LEQLRAIARLEKAADDLLDRSDRDLLGALGLIRNGRLLHADVLLAGKSNAIHRSFSSYVWTHLRMSSDTEYSDRADGTDALPTALGRILDRIMADNPITTVRQGLFHYEIRTYPDIALREAILNALVHAEYRIPGPILIKHFLDRLEISNPGGLPGGVTPENILRHDLHRRLSAPGHPERDRRIAWEAAKMRVLSIMMERARRGQPGLSNEEIRQFTHYDRNQSRRLMMELMRENQSIRKEGLRRWTRYAYSIGFKIILLDCVIGRRRIFIQPPPLLVLQV
jgi:hypothetical protein